MSPRLFLVAVGLLLPAAACRVAERPGPLLDVTVFEPKNPEHQWIDDVIVWPAQQNGTALTPDLLERFRNRMHAGMRDRRYSVLSRPMIDRLAGQLGTSDDAALTALTSKDADGVLVVHFTSWDERGLLSLGRVRADGTLKLIGRGGHVRWQGRIRCDQVLLDAERAPRDLDARRELAVERLAELLSARLPAHEA